MASQSGTRHLTPAERRTAYELLLQGSSNGRLKYGALKDVAAHLKCHWKTVSRVWKRGRHSLSNGSPHADVASKLKTPASDPPFSCGTQWTSEDIHRPSHARDQEAKVPSQLHQAHAH
ncbi:hypothetical protein H257_17251 [Aphanomyces astaci]|uniref:DUF7769 domain-containing protein n=1 Tax=Aphanomyces astaci TaxID=112090 RepID=W4FHR0_APHAT|nr:hypothetical protein H257_17251 [Aphanomyces astaci]ETV66283.1 hypothetical protein H257_17251 [Aphanomyces astaci]|eukprot:XP_009844270.1 hypothetical protein H257_17251 [Aphanomyces astaci]